MSAQHVAQALMRTNGNSSNFNQPDKYILYTRHWIHSTLDQTSTRVADTAPSCAAVQLAGDAALTCSIAACWPALSI